MEALLEGARRLGIALSAEQRRQFTAHLDGLREWNRRVNLTSAAALADAERVHFVDSLTLAPLIQCLRPDAERLLDVGSGAGFPGLPLKIALTRMRVTLIEATGKKAAFLRWAVEALGLEGVDVLNGRAEEAAREPALRGKFDVVTARALGPLPVVLELTQPFARPGALVALPRAGDVASEAAAAAPIAALLGGRMLKPAPVDMPGLRADAAIVLVEQVSPSPERYPRRTGLPATQPLVGKPGIGR